MSQGYFLLGRVSTNRQLRGYSIPTQLEEGRQYAAQHHLDIIDEYADQESGSVLKRDGLDDIRRRLAGGEGQGIIVHTVDRLTRDPADLFTVRKELQQSGYKIHVVRRGGAAETPEQEASEDFDVVFAKYERSKIRERTMRGMYAKVQAGKVPGHGTAKYGYQFIGLKETKDLIHHPDEQRVLHRIKELFLVQRLRISDIARTLSDEGVPTRADQTGHRGKRGTGWNEGTIRNMLRDSIYSGTMYTHRFYKVKGKARLRPREEWIPVPVLPTFDAPTWVAIQARLDDSKRRSQRNTKREYLLRCCLACACGASAHGTTNTHGTAWYYVCASRHTVKGYCGLPQMPGEVVNGAVWNWIERVVLNPDELQRRCVAHNAAQQRQQAPLAEWERLAADIARVEAQRQTLLDALLQGVFTLGEVSRRKAALDAEHARLSRSRAALEHEDTSIPTDTQASLQEYVSVIRDGFASLTSLADRQQLLSLLGFRLEFAPTLGGIVGHARCHLQIQTLGLIIDAPTRASLCANTPTLIITDRIMLMPV